MTAAHGEHEWYDNGLRRQCPGQGVYPWAQPDIAELESAVIAGLEERMPKPMNSEMEKHVKNELETMNKGKGVNNSLSEGALLMARALDRFASTAESAAHLSAIVKAHQELRATLALLRRADAEVADEDSSARDAAALSTPVRDATDT
jgi:hypothetical protein